MSEHSPTPWRARPFDERDFAYLYDARDLSICLDHYETEHNRATVSRADAEHIVKCVNLHGKLAAALELCLEDIHTDAIVSRDAINALLAEAKGEA